MARDSFLDRLHAALWQLLKRRHGSIRRIERALGQCHNYLWTQRERKTFRLVTILEILSFLKVSPSWFFRSISEIPADPVEDFIAEAEAVLDGSQVPRAARRTAERFMTRKADATPPSSAEREQLEELEQLRQSDREAALEGAARLAQETSSPHTAAQALGVMASALRVDVDQLETAQVVLAAAFKIARVDEDREVEARLLLRGCYILSDRGFPEQALSFAETSLVIFSESGSDGGVGRSHLLRATMLRRLGRNVQAERAYRACLLGLDETDAHCLAAVEEGLGFCSRVRGALETAENHYERAERLIPAQAQASRARIVWERARLASQRGDLGSSNDLYREAVEGLGRLPVDAALAGSEWIRVLLLAGNQNCAQRVVRELGGLLFQLDDKEQPTVQAALMRLYRAAASRDELSIRLINEVIGELELHLASPRAGLG